MWSSSWNQITTRGPLVPRRVTASVPARWGTSPGQRNGCGAFAATILRSAQFRLAGVLAESQPDRPGIRIPRSRPTSAIRCSASRSAASDGGTDSATAKATRIFDTTRQIFALADEEDVPPAVAADRIAERRIAEVGRLRGILLPFG